MLASSSALTGYLEHDISWGGETIEAHHMRAAAHVLDTRRTDNRHVTDGREEYKVADRLDLDRKGYGSDTRTVEYGTFP